MKGLPVSLLLLVSSALAADVRDPKSCTAFPCLIFDEDFNFLDHDIWEHEITMAGGGNGEFQVYLNNRSVSYTSNSVLYIKPQLVSDWKGKNFLSGGTLNLWGMDGRGSVCTSNAFNGCYRQGSYNQIVNPVMSARLRSLPGFSFKYGRIEVRAKMPHGDWLWPAVWMLPQYFPYGSWPASGEIDIVESRGNDNYGWLSNKVAGSTLHWGPYWPLDFYQKTTVTYSPRKGSYADDFHVWRIDWTSRDIKVYVDGELKKTFDPINNFWWYSGLENSTKDNPWRGGEKMAPFDQEFYIIINLAVGGTGGYFPDGISKKPWVNTSPQAMYDFWNGHTDWLPTWEHGENRISEKAALQVDYVKVWKMGDSSEQTNEGKHYHTCLIFGANVPCTSNYVVYVFSTLGVLVGIACILELLRKLFLRVRSHFNKRKDPVSLTDVKGDSWKHLGS